MPTIWKFALTLFAICAFSPAVADDLVVRFPSYYTLHYTGEITGVGTTWISFRTDGPATQTPDDSIFYSAFDESRWTYLVSTPPGGGSWHTGGGLCNPAYDDVSTVTLTCDVRL